MSGAKHNKSDEQGEPLRYASSYHAPVLCDNVVQGLVTDPAGLYVDATLGGGGHSAALLDRLEASGRVIGIDQDADALAEAGRRLVAAAEAGRFVGVRGNFADMQQLLRPLGITRVHGILLDLGVSSHQLNAASRGFSYQGAARLDMRMDDRAALSAYEIVNTWGPVDLGRLIGKYGEEPKAMRIAHRIADRRPLETTDALAQVVRSVVSDREAHKTLARVFQALRIAVNEELDVLERVLSASVDLVRPGGRIAVISYHSLEDRRVKRFLRYGNLDGKPVRDFYGHLITPWRLISRKAIQPGDSEISLNPRARSARLRIAERVEASPSQAVA